MAISPTQLASIKKHIADFKAQNGFDKKEATSEEFIKQVFYSLGWDTKNIGFKEHQDNTGKFPDFNLKDKFGNLIFIIEAKEPKANSLDGKYGKTSFVEQLCGYCSSNGVYWGLLTNFVEWRIYNTKQYAQDKHFYRKLTIFDNKEITCSDKDLSDFFELLTFSNLSKNKGRISKENIYYPPVEEIKQDFFTNLKRWRSDLRNYIYKNCESNSDEADNQTQKILDRLIFIGYCHKKEIISQDYFRAILSSNKQKYYVQLKHNFEELDDQFNSELFATDKCDKYNIADDVIAEIIEGIGRIDFSNIDAHILGEVYENYLGELLKAGKEKISTGSEHKEHQKRKSQGIYYTPDYIVNYIVDNTVGELLKNCKTEKEVEQLKVLDPACGSGSFLLKAYDSFYKAYEKFKPKNEPFFWELNTRKKILLHNLFGVDLDERATEIARLNLLLRALEGIQEPQNEKRKKILPNISLNIRCGNSLVSGKYEDDEESNETQLSFIFDKNSEHKNDLKKLIELKEKFYREEENDAKDKILNEVKLHEGKINKDINKHLKKYFLDTDKIKALNYDVAFCEVMKNGGFDCIIGNPPYVQLSMEKTITKGYKNYLLNEYKSAMGRFNTFAFFVKKSSLLIRQGGLSGLIIPNTILTQEYYKDLRKYLLDNTSIRAIVNYDGMTFKDAVVENVTLIIQKQIQKNNRINIVDYSLDKIKESIIEQSSYNKSYQNQFNKAIDKGTITLKNKILKAGFLLGEKFNINQAIALKSDRAMHLFDSKRGEIYKPVIDGKEIDRYQLNWDSKYLKYDIDAIHSCKRTDIFECKEKIFFGRVSSFLKATYDNKKFYALNTIVVITPKNKKEVYSLKFILGIFNSSLANYYYSTFLKSTKKVFSEIQARTVKQIPMPIIDFKNISSKKNHERMVELVNEILLLSKFHIKNEKKIQVVDSQINDLVYKLYGISILEQKIIEASFKAKKVK